MVVLFPELKEEKLKGEREREREMDLVVTNAIIADHYRPRCRQAVVLANSIHVLSLSSTPSPFSRTATLLNRAQGAARAAWPHAIP